MTSFETLTLVVACLALIGSLVVWSGQRRLQREANELQRVTADLSKRQLQIIQQQESAFYFSVKWRSIRASIVSFVENLSDWQRRAQELVNASSGNRLPELPELILPDYESIDWTYSPTSRLLLDELVIQFRNLNDQLGSYNFLRKIGSEDFWIAVTINNGGADDPSRFYEDFGGQEAFSKSLMELLDACHVKEGQHYTAIVSSPQYQQMLDKSHRTISELIAQLGQQLTKVETLAIEFNERFVKESLG